MDTPPPLIKGVNVHPGYGLSGTIIFALRFCRFRENRVKNGAHLSTRQQAHICCRVKTWSKYSLFWGGGAKLGPSFLCFFLVLFFKNLLLSARRMRLILKKNEQKKKPMNIFLSQNLVQFCCATYLDQVLTQTWTKFSLNIFANLGYFYLFERCRNHYFYSAFSKKTEF